MRMSKLGREIRVPLYWRRSIGLLYATSMRRNLIGALAAGAIALLAARHRRQRLRELRTPVSGRARGGQSRALAGTVATTAGVAVCTIALRVTSRDAVRAVFAASTVLAAIRPASGVLWWIAAAGAAVPPLVSVRQASVRLSAASIPVLVLAWAFRGGAGRGRPRRVSSIEEPLWWMTAIAVASAARGSLRPDRGVIPLHRSVLVQTYAASLVVSSSAAALLVARSLRSRNDFRWVWWVVVVLGLMQPMLGRLGREASLQPKWGPLLASHAASLVFADMLFSPPARGWVRWLEAACVAAVAAEVVGAQMIGRRDGQWVSGWVALGASLGTILGLRSSGAFIVGLGATIVAMGALRHHLRQRVDDARGKGDFERPAMWRDALGLAARRPLLGVGPGNYMDYMIRYTRAPFTAGPVSRGVHPGIGSAHGNYPQVAAEMGFAGLFTLGWVIARTAGSARALVRRAEDREVAAVAAGALGAIAGQVAASLLGDYVLPSYYNGGHASFSTTVYTWILVGTIMALETCAPADTGPRGLLTA
jgi:hypothetical protein